MSPVTAPSEPRHQQLDLLGAAAARDHALQLVLEKAGPRWREQARVCIRHHFGDCTGTAEEFRLSCLEAGLMPHHHNAWGGLINYMVRSNELQLRGYGRMKTKRSHARATPLYWVLPL